MVWTWPFNTGGGGVRKIWLATQKQITTPPLRMCKEIQPLS